MNSSSVSRGKSNRSRTSRRPFDIVHITQSKFPEDPRPRREAGIATEVGERVVVIALGASGSVPEVGRYGRVVVVRLPGERRRGSAFSYLVEYVGFLRRARRLVASDARFRQARVFHVHTLPDFLVAATGPARKVGARVILDLHELFPEFIRSKFGSWTGAIGERIGRRLERWSRRRADRVVTVNEAVADRLRTRPARRGETISVVHNFADPAEFGPGGLTDGQVQGPLRLVYHGTLTPLYGLDLAIEAVELARASGVDARFDIYGDGQSGEELRQQIRDLRLDSFVSLKGVVSHHVLRERLPGYHAGLVPTRLDVMTRFSLSTKLLEYIHLGIPAIIPAIPTYLDYFPATSAWYFTPNSASEAARAIARFASADPAERVRRAREAQQHAARRLDAVRDATVLKQIYQKLLEARPAQEPR
jgi:glycosyltransferase involved in cell wall biosynthesis